MGDSEFFLELVILISGLVILRVTMRICFGCGVKFYNVNRESYF